MTTTPRVSLAHNNTCLSQEPNMYTPGGGDIMSQAKLLHQGDGPQGPNSAGLAQTGLSLLYVMQSSAQRMKIPQDPGPVGSFNATVTPQRLVTNKLLFVYRLREQIVPPPHHAITPSIPMIRVLPLVVHLFSPSTVPLLSVDCCASSFSAAAQIVCAPELKICV